MRSPCFLRFSKSLPLSEDSETGEVRRKRFRGPSLEEDEEMDGAMKVKGKNKWGDREASSSFSQEVRPSLGLASSTVRWVLFLP